MGRYTLIGCSLCVAIGAAPNQCCKNEGCSRRMKGGGSQIQAGGDMNRSSDDDNDDDSDGGLDDDDTDVAVGAANDSLS